MKTAVIPVARSMAGSAWVRLFLALVLLTGSLGALAITSYADQYVNGGVSWGDNLPLVNNAVGNPLGTNLFLEKEVDPAKVEKTVRMTHDAGIKWVRQVFAWNDIEISAKGDFMDRRGPGPPVSGWDKYDRIVDTLRKYDLEIIARIDSPPVWARIPGDDVETYRKGPPRDYNDYADFARAVAERYKGKVKYFQIWNEPNLFGEWGGHAVNPAEYTELLKKAYIAIKSVNPDAVIITAALAPTAEQSLRNLNDLLYLEGMYKAGAAPYFDILSTMLYGLGQPPNERRTDLSRLNFSRPILLRNVMEKYGDIHKPVWISEYGWISLPDNWDEECANRPADSPCGQNIWGKSVDEQTQAKWIVEGYERIRQEWPWVGAVCIWFMRDPDPVPGEPANYFSILNPDFTPRPAYNAVKEYSKRFPVADTGKYPVDGPAIATSVEYKSDQGSNIIIGNALPSTVLTETISFAGNRLYANLCADCTLSVLSMDGSPPRTLNDTDKSIINGTPRTRGSPTAQVLASNLKDVPHKATLLAYIGPSSANDPAAIALTVSRDKPLVDALGFPLLYGLFGLLALASAEYTVGSAGKWVSAALDIPRGRYSEDVREKARNACALVGMVLLTALYWKTENLPLILVCLAGLGLLAFLKPSIALTAAVVTIPLFWYPKDIRGQHYPLAETMLLIVFGAFMARRIAAYRFPRLVRMLNFAPIDTGDHGQGLPAGFSANGKNGQVGTQGDGTSPDEQTIPFPRHVPVLTEQQLDELLPARWPKRPVTAPLGSTKIQVARVAAPTGRLASTLDTAPLPMQEDGRRSHTTGKLVIDSKEDRALPALRGIIGRLAALDRQDRFALPAMALVLAATIAMLTLANPAFARDSARAYRWVIIEPVLLYFLVTDLVRTRRGIWRIADFFVITGVAIALLGIWQFLTGTNTVEVEGVRRVLGVYEHPNNLALYLGRVMPFAVCAGLFLPAGPRKWLYLLAGLPLGVTTFLTFSRGAYLAVTLAIAVGIVVGLRTGAFPRKEPVVGEATARDRRVLWASIAALVVGLALISTAALLPKIPQRIFAMGSGELRVDLWATSLRMLRDHPIFGIGPDQFLNQFQSHYMTEAQKGESFTAHPHNILLDYWLTLGIMGVPILLWLLWRFFREAVGKARSLALGNRSGHAGRALAIGLLAGIVDFAVHGLVDNSYFLMDLAMIFWLSCALLTIADFRLRIAE